MNTGQYFFVLTGGPGVGKTTLLQELCAKGFEYVPEVAREIIKEQMESAGNALPWKDKEAYSKLMVDRSIQAYISALQRNSKDILFFDRGIPDRLAYCKLVKIAIPQDLRSAVHQYRYNKKFSSFLPGRKFIKQILSESKILKKP